jgi:hypothetical protein
MARLSSAAHDLVASSGEFLSKEYLWRELVTEENTVRRSALASCLRAIVEEQRNCCRSLDEMLSLSVTIGILDFVEDAHVWKGFTRKAGRSRQRRACVVLQR